MRRGPVFVFLLLLSPALVATPETVPVAAPVAAPVRSPAQAPIAAPVAVAPFKTPSTDGNSSISPIIIGAILSIAAAFRFVLVAG